MNAMTLDDSATLLAIDTSTPSCSIALRHQGIHKQQMEHDERRHTQVILPLTDTLLKETHLTMNDLSGIIISAGPGAFTGLRVGAAVAMGIGCAQNIPLLAISSLALLAASAARQHGNGCVLALLDARMNQVYAGFYLCTDGNIVALGEDCLCSPEDLPAQWLTRADYLVGSGCVYPFLQTSGKILHADVQPEAIDAFNLLDHGQWQSAWNGISLRYLRNEIVQS